MTKIIIISDSHGDLDNIRKIMKKEKDAECRNTFGRFDWSG